MSTYNFRFTPHNHELHATVRVPCDHSFTGLITFMREEGVIHSKRWDRELVLTRHDVKRIVIRDLTAALAYGWAEAKAEHGDTRESLIRIGRHGAFRVNSLVHIIGTLVKVLDSTARVPGTWTFFYE